MSDNAKFLALAESFTVLVLSLRDSNALHPQNFMDNSSAARNRLVHLGHTECVDAMDELMKPIAQALGFEGQEHPQP